jgi:hypothetical protein
MDRSLIQIPRAAKRKAAVGRKYQSECRTASLQGLRRRVQRNINRILESRLRSFVKQAYKAMVTADPLCRMVMLLISFTRGREGTSIDRPLNRRTS